jgi:prepilin-type N-terminal cleavage/methylation domain-containing protein
MTYRKRCDQKSNKGFTLVELLVVISIIALLLSVLMPSLNKARNQAKKLVCGNNTKMLSTANQIYGNDWNGSCVPYLVVNSLYPNGQIWFNNTSFRKYMNYDSRRMDNSGYIDKKFRCPADTRSEDPALYNNFVSVAYNFTGLLIPPWNFPTPVAAFRFAEVPRPSSKFEFMDGLDYGLHEGTANYKLIWNRWGNKSGAISRYWNAPAFRHTEGAVVAFFDSHTEYRKKETCYLYTPNRQPDQAANDAMWKCGSGY